MAIATNTTPTTTTTATIAPTATTNTSNTSAPKTPSTSAPSGKDPYWDINGTTAGSGGPTPSGTWSTSVANWNSSSAGTSATAVWSNGANAATFSAGTDATGAYTVTVSGTVTASSITFEEGTVTLAGTSTPVLTLSAGVTINSTINGTTTFGSSLNNVIISASQNWANNSSQAFNIASGVQASASSTLTLNGSGSGATTFSGVLANGAGTLSLAVNTTGTGVITLSGANTYTGSTTIDGATVKLGNATALGTTAGSTTVGSNTDATLDLNGQTVGAEPLDITGVGVGGNGVLVNNSGTAASFSGNIVTHSDPTLGGTGNMTLSGVISGGSSGSSALHKVGTGTVFLTGNNTYGRPTLIQAGVINIQNANALGAASAPNNGGSSDTVVSSGAALQLQGGFMFAAEGLTLNGTGISNDGALRSISGANTYTGAIVLGSTGVRINSDTAGVALTLSNAAGITGTGFALTVGGVGDTVISTGGINTSTSGTLTKDGTGTLTISAAGNYTGLTTVSAGILNIQNATATGTTAGGVAVSNGATLQLQNSITVGAEALTLNGGAASGQNGDLVNVSGTNTYGGAITLATAASTISSDAGSLNLTNTITNSTFGLTLTGASSGTVSGVIGSGSGTLAKTGAGTWTLSGTSANTYTGLTTVSAGELDLGKTANVNAIGSGGLTITGGTVKYTGTSTDEIADTANVTVSGGTLDLNNHADTIGSLTFNSGTLTSTGGTQTLTLAGSTATTLQMQGAATIPAAVNVTFSSTTTSGVGMTFDASANGTATINGNINLNSSATTGVTRTFTINNGSAATDTTISGVISNTTSTALTKAGTGTLVLSGANTYGGATTVNAGSLLVYNTTGSGTGTGSITVNNSGTTFGGGTTTGVGGVSGSVNVAAGANIAPSNSSGATGILSTGALTLASTSNFLVDINGTTVGTGFDQLKVTGGASIAGSNLLVSVGAAFIQSDVGDKFAILSNVSAGLVSGTFSGLSEGASFNSGVDRFMITYVGNAGDATNGNDIVLTLTAVPEPSTWLAAALALGAVGYMQRRRLRELVRRVVIS